MIRDIVLLQKREWEQRLAERYIERDAALRPVDDERVETREWYQLQGRIQFVPLWKWLAADTFHHFCNGAPAASGPDHGGY